MSGRSSRACFYLPCCLILLIQAQAGCHPQSHLQAFAGHCQHARSQVPTEKDKGDHGLRPAICAKGHEL